MVPDLGIFGIGVAPGRPREAEDPGWIQELVDASEKVLDSLDTCHYCGRGQILITTL